MQSDLHYYMTYALALRVGFTKQDAMELSWNNQFTDECTQPELYGMRTQCDPKGDWFDKTVQSDVIIPFHFLPGDDKKKPWMVTPMSTLSYKLLTVANKQKDLKRFGIALHSFQDTFSHQGWTGWEEKFNACYWWRVLPVPLPNVGHTDMGIAPDIVGHVWTDPRTGEKINNDDRVKDCIYYTALWLYSYVKGVVPKAEVNQICLEIEPFFSFKSNEIDKRKKWLMDWVGFDITYTEAYEIMKPKIPEFVRAARQHLAIVMEHMSLI